MNEAVFKTILHRIKGAPDKPERGREPESSPAETVAAQVLAEYEPSEADRIVRVWHDTMGINLKSERVRLHLEALRKWQSRWHDNGLR